MNIYVGNLPYSTTDADLQELFQQFGAVASARVILDKISGRSKGFGFVEMPEADDANKAIRALDQQDYQGRNLKVNESQPMPPRGDRGYGGGGGGGRGHSGGHGRGRDRG